ncbi:hypothetical protein [Streptomyces sp. NPDC018031]|uniref:hypothetical protein n=1 Tax=Streptomyces sp. NPDC018031 TaxID=3365033 RepID=UPI003791DE97
MALPFPQWLAGQRITAAGLNSRNWVRVTQGTDITRISSTTMTNTNLVITGAAGAEYYFKALIAYGASIDSDMQWAWSIPGDASMTRFTEALSIADVTLGSASAHTVVMRRPAASTGVSAGGTDAAAIGSATTTFNSAYDQGIVTFGVAGTATLQFAQNTSDADGTTFRSTSYLLYTRIA